MKQIVMTGKAIHEELKKLREDLEELGEACDMVSDKLGQKHVAFKLLDKQFVAKSKELSHVENKKYEMYIPDLPETPF